jgi:class 3 adenylate cyclase/tetratricopeptide (TPR) repeat protein
MGCGARLAARCASCGTDLPSEARFCFSCGAAVVTGTTSALRSVDSYTPKHLAERILTSKAALEGERKQVTVLFADLKGSMELLADRDPEEARKLLDPVIEHMMEAVHRYEGTVNQVMGDGIMALFGAPLAHEDHAVRACYAALRMQESIKRYSEGVRRVEGIPIRIRVGLNSGEVVVRSIGSDLHMDYTAVGQTTHLAARMEQIAAPGTSVMAPATLTLAEGFVEVKSLGPTPVKGIADALEVYELIGASAMRSRLQAAAARGLTKFVGRSAEVTQLHEALDLVRSGKGQVVAVVGEAGVGKSRLFWEFTHSHATAGCVAVEAASVSYGKATPYYPVIELLKSYFGVEARDGARTVREKVTGKLLSLDRALESALPALLSLVDAVDDDQWKRLDPPQRRQRTLDGVKRLLLRESQVQPVLVIFEDLFWIDIETQAMLDGLVESLPTARMMLLVNYRPEYQHGWGSKTYYRQLRIDPLPAATAAELLKSLLGPDPALAPLTDLLVGRTEGNPFFLEETVRTLVETKALAGERGRYRLTQPVQAIQVPPTVQVILAARIDRLAPEDKRLLQTCSVVGEDLPFSLLQAIADLSDEALRRGLDHLQVAEFLYETGLFPDLEYTFKHALTHEVTYGGLLQERLRELHARIVDAIETLPRDRLGEQVERLAHHAVRGELREKAVHYLRQAGSKAMARSAHQEAVAYLEKALTALQHLPETQRTLEHAVDVRFELRTALLPLGKLDQMLGYLREAERLVAKLDDPRRLGWLAAYMSLLYWQIGQVSHAHTYGQRVHAIAERLGDISLRVLAGLYLGLAHIASGDYVRASDSLASTVGLFGGDGALSRHRQAVQANVTIRAYLTVSLAMTGDFARGAAYGHDGLAFAEAIDHPFSLIFTSWGLGVLYGLKGDLDRAAGLLERSLALATRWEVTLMAPIARRSLGWIYAQSGRVTEGLTFLREALDEQEALGLLAFQTLLIAQLGEASLLAGQLGDAGAFASRALALARERGERGHEAYALGLLADVAAHRHHPGDVDAEEHYRHAIRVADEHRMRPLVAHCHAGLAKLYGRTGKREQAREQLATANRDVPRDGHDVLAGEGRGRRCRRLGAGHSSPVGFVGTGGSGTVRCREPLQSEDEQPVPARSLPVQVAVAGLKNGEGSRLLAISPPSRVPRKAGGADSPH